MRVWASSRACRSHSRPRATTPSPWRQSPCPDVLEVTGTTESGVIMALWHREVDVEGVQFHPESVLTEGGHALLANWLVVCGDSDAPNRAEGLAPVVG